MKPKISGDLAHGEHEGNAVRAAESSCLSFPEACAALADVYENCPEAWVARWFVADVNGNGLGSRTLSPEASAWCAIGGVSAALGKDGWNDLDAIRENLKPFAKKLGFDDPADASNSGRDIAIKMLRMAAGQIKAKGAA